MSMNIRSNLRGFKQESNSNLKVNIKRSSNKKLTFRGTQPKFSLEIINDYKRRIEETPEKVKRKISSNTLSFKYIEEKPKNKINGHERVPAKTKLITPNIIRTAKPSTKKSSKLENNKGMHHVSFKEKERDKNNCPFLKKISNKQLTTNYSINDPKESKEFKKSVSNYCINRPKIPEDKINKNIINNKNNKNVKNNNNIINNKNNVVVTNRKERAYSLDKAMKMKNSLLKTNNNMKIEINVKKYKDDSNSYNKKFLPTVVKHERIIDNRPNNRKNQPKDEDDDWDIEEFQGFQKKTVDVSKIRKKNVKNPKDKNNRINKINTEFSKLEYVKISKAMTVAGRSEDGLKKINQDTFICERNINGVLNFNMFGVLDGHGVNGHLVSQFVSKFIINRIKNIPSIKKLDSPKEIYELLKSKGYQIIASAYMDADVQVAKEKFDCLRSGTTCVIVFQCDEHIICANAGDSRAIMIYDESNNDSLKKTKVYPLSYDCKPDIPMERLRIIKNGGTVEQFLDDNDKGVGPFRVFIKGQEDPGLAMSRSIGDVEAKTVGVIPNPQIIEYEINPKSKYMIICSDGIWEFISNEEAMEIGKKYYIRHDPVGLCNELISKSTEIWKVEDEVIDDITVVVVFF